MTSLLIIMTSTDVMLLSETNDDQQADDLPHVQR